MEVTQMARHKGANPDNTAKDAAEDVAVALESAAEEMTVMEEGAEATVYASGSAEAEESLHGNLVVESVRSGAAAAQEAVARFVPAVGDPPLDVHRHEVHRPDRRTLGARHGSYAPARIGPEDLDDAPPYEAAAAQHRDARTHSQVC